MPAPTIADAARRKATLVLGLSLALLTAMALHPRPASGQQIKGLYIQGKIHTSDGEPLPNDLSVRLEKTEGYVVAQQFVGTDGKFQFSNLEEETFKVVATAKGYQPAEAVVDMHYLASRFPNLYLTKADKKEVTTSTSPTVSATDLAASKKARKEYEKGHEALQSGKYDEARAHLEKAIAEEPCYARAHATLGVVLSMQHQFAPAEAALRKSISCDAGFLEGHIQLALLLNAQSKFVESENALQAGLQHFPGEWQLYYQLGIAERGLRQLDKAEAAYLKAQSLNPNVPPEFHVKLADVLLREKKYDPAYAEMQAYLRAAPTGEYAEETKGLMKRLETSGLITEAQDKPGAPPK